MLFKYLQANTNNKSDQKKTIYSTILQNIVNILLTIITCSF